MVINEKERLMLVEKKNEIRKLTEEIIDIKNYAKQKDEVKKKILGILSNLSTISGYTKSKKGDLSLLNEWVDDTFALIDMPQDMVTKYRVKVRIESFCTYVNSIIFDFTKRTITIILPKLDITLFKKG